MEQEKKKRVRPSMKEFNELKAENEKLKADNEALAKKCSGIGDIYLELADYKSDAEQWRERAEERKATIDALMSRNLWQRIFNIIPE